MQIFMLAMVSERSELEVKGDTELCRCEVAEAPLQRPTLSRLLCHCDHSETERSVSAIRHRRVSAYFCQTVGSGSRARVFLITSSQLRCSRLSHPLLEVLLSAAARYQHRSRLCSAVEMSTFIKRLQTAFQSREDTENDMRTKELTRTQ